MLKTLKNHLFTKAICSTLLLSSLAISTPQKAEAGLLMIIAPISFGVAPALIVAGSVGGSALLAGGGMLAAFSGTSGDRSERFGLPAVLILTLDENAPVDSQIEAGLAQRYSFIEDRTVISHLAQVITERSASAPLEADGSCIARLSREEITEILAPTDLLDTDTYSAEVEAMIQDLQ